MSTLDDDTLASSVPTPTDDAPDESTLSEPAAHVSDAAPDAVAEDFDLSEWAQGVEPNRARVVLSSKNGRLVERMEAIVDEVKDAEMYGEDTSVLEAEHAELAAKVKAGRRVLVVEGRSRDWHRALVKQAKKQGLDPAKQEDADTILYRQIAGQIVSPTRGVGPQAVRAIAENNPTEYEKLVVAVARVQTRAAVTPGLSRKPSGERRSG